MTARTPKRVKVCLHPRAAGEDDGQGGIRRVIDGQQRHLPALGIDFVDDPGDADVIACHIQFPDEWLKNHPLKPFVLHCHGLYWSEYDWPKWALSVNESVMEAIRTADAVTVPSEWVADVLARHTCRQATVIPHGLDLDEWGPGTAVDRDTLPYVLWDKTRPDPVCDPRVVNELAALLPDVQFISTFGDVASNVAIVGRKPFAEAKALVQHAGLYLATSMETFGVATLQALACGVPVVGYAWGAQPEILTPGLDSWLAKPGDVAELARGIRHALSELPAMRAAARETAERYSWAKPMEQYARLYRRLAADAAAYRPSPRGAKRLAPRTSVVLTAYKLADYLGDAIESVLAQTDPNVELVIVDDASPDRCGEIADAYATRSTHAGPPVTVIHNAKNIGQAASRNVGIAAAHGRYILPLDADDMLPPTAVEILAGHLDMNRGTGVAYGNVRFVEPDGVTPIVYRPDEAPGHSGWPFEWDFKKQVRGYNLLPYSSMFRRAAWEGTAGYRERLRNDDDPDFWLRVSSYGWRPAKVTDADTLVYRVRGDSMSRTVPHGDWAGWFGWRGTPVRSPAGATLDRQLPIPCWLPPAISVVIPVGPGHERLFMTAVDSCEAQTFARFEVIVVNDSARELARMPPWVKVLNRHVVTGTGNARNWGASKAKGSHLLFLDADDYLQPDALEVWAKAAAERPDVVFYADMWEDVDANGRQLPPGEFRRLEWPDATGEIYLRGAVGAVTQLIPRAAFEAVGGFDGDMVGWEDWAILLKLADAGVCSARIARPLWTYRKFTGSRRDSWLAADTYPKAKAAIIERFPGIFAEDETERRRLMACGCSGNANATYAATSTATAAIGGSEFADAQLVQYTGPAVAGVDYRAPSGTRYRWAAGRTQYVRPEDVAYFVALGEFGIVERTAEGFAPVGTAPALIA